MYGYLVYGHTHDVIYDSGSIYSCLESADDMASSTAVDMDGFGYDVYFDDGFNISFVEV